MISKKNVKLFKKNVKLPKINMRNIIICIIIILIIIILVILIRQYKEKFNNDDDYEKIVEIFENHIKHLIKYDFGSSKQGPPTNNYVSISLINYLIDLIKNRDYNKWGPTKPPFVVENYPNKYKYNEPPYPTKVTDNNASLLFTTLLLFNSKMSDNSKEKLEQILCLTLFKIKEYIEKYHSNNINLNSIFKADSLSNCKCNYYYNKNNQELSYSINNSYNQIRKSWDAVLFDNLDIYPLTVNELLKIDTITIYQTTFTINYKDGNGIAITLSFDKTPKNINKNNELQNIVKHFETWKKKHKELKKNIPTNIVPDEYLPTKCNSYYPE
jgi:hypothetical protein